MAYGATVCIRRKFSVKAWSSDCVKFKCTVCQYIGEMARYLVNAPANDQDKNVKLEYAFGNGMKPEVWPEFQKRYATFEIFGLHEFDCNCCTDTMSSM